MKTYLYRASNLKSTITFLASFHSGSQFLATAKTTVSSNLLIRECGTTLYVGLAPDNTNFRLTFLQTRLQEAVYEDLAV